MKEGDQMRKEWETVKAYYDENAVKEWERLENNPFEFLFTTYMMERWIKPGDRILDIGGGPGRYSIYFAQKGCDVTLVDLSEGNIALAKEKAKEQNVTFSAFAKNCLELDALDLGQFDHVFLMGPLYHLKEEAEQRRAVSVALSHLKPGGKLYVSFILLFAGVLYNLQNAGCIMEDFGNPETKVAFDQILTGENYTGPAFTSTCFFHQNNILPFMEQFPLKKLSLFGQEGILGPNRLDIVTRSREELDSWIQVGKMLLEVPELLSYSEHAMYIGEKL